MDLRTAIQMEISADERFVRVFGDEQLHTIDGLFRHVEGSACESLPGGRSEWISTRDVIARMRPGVWGLIPEGSRPIGHDESVTVTRYYRPRKSDEPVEATS